MKNYARLEEAHETWQPSVSCDSGADPFALKDIHWDNRWSWRDIWGVRGSRFQCELLDFGRWREHFRRKCTVSTWRWWGILWTTYSQCFGRVVSATVHIYFSSPFFFHLVIIFVMLEVKPRASHVWHARQVFYSWAITQALFLHLWDCYQIKTKNNRQTEQRWVMESLEGKRGGLRRDGVI
jgi:hypothetical protein